MNAFPSLTPPVRSSILPTSMSISPCVLGVLHDDDLSG